MSRRVSTSVFVFRKRVASNKVKIYTKQDHLVWENPNPECPAPRAAEDTRYGTR